MKILAFDIATSTGVAFCNTEAEGWKPQSKVIDLGYGKTDDRRCYKCFRIVTGMITEHQPDLVAIECPIGPKASGLLWGLYYNATTACRRLNTKFIVYQVASIRKHFLGKHLTVRDYPGLKKDEARREIKRVVMNRCRALGWPVDTDDQADALALLDYALAMNGKQTTPQGGLFDNGWAAE